MVPNQMAIAPAFIPVYVMNGSDSPNFQHSTDQNWTEEAFHLLRIQSLSLKYFSS